MPPRPLYRWKSFWAGVLILASLGLSWLRSIEYEDWINVGTPGLSGGIAHANARLGIYYNDVGSTESGWGSAPSPAATWFPSFVDATAFGSHHGSMGAHAHLLLAHWLLILLFLIPWSTSLLWRLRRMKRRTAGA